MLESEIYTKSGTSYWYFLFFIAVVELTIYIHIVFSYACPLDLLSVVASRAEFLCQWSGQGDQIALSRCWSVGGQEGSAEESMVLGQWSEVQHGHLSGPPLSHNNPIQAGKE